MKNSKDDQSEDKASKRLEQFREAREPTEEPCEDKDVESSPKKLTKKVKNSPKPPESNENPRRKKR